MWLCETCDCTQHQGLLKEIYFKIDFYISKYLYLNYMATMIFQNTFRDANLAEKVNWSICKLVLI